MCAGLFYVVGQLSFGKQYNDFSEFFVGGGGDQERNGQVFFQCGLYLRPKRFVPVFKLPLTETGKPDRAIAKLLAQK